jgi:hypothetical protein
LLRKIPPPSECLEPFGIFQYLALGQAILKGFIEIVGQKQERIALQDLLTFEQAWRGIQAFAQGFFFHTAIDNCQRVSGRQRPWLRGPDGGAYSRTVATPINIITSNTSPAARHDPALLCAYRRVSKKRNTARDRQWRRQSH